MGEQSKTKTILFYDTGKEYEPVGTVNELPKLNADDEEVKNNVTNFYSGEQTMVLKLSWWSSVKLRWWTKYEIAKYRIKRLIRKIFDGGR